MEAHDTRTKRTKVNGLKLPSFDSGGGVRVTAVDIKVASSSRQLANELPAVMVAPSFEARVPVSDSPATEGLKAGPSAAQRPSPLTQQARQQVDKKVSSLRRQISYGSILNNTQRRLKKEYQKGATMHLAKGWWWTFKTFYLFPVVIPVLLKLDHIARVVFPVAYGTFMLYQLNEVDFGRDQVRQLTAVPCYTLGA